MAGEDSTISVTCTCGKKLRAAATSAGKRVKCPGCGEAITLPAAAVTVVAAAVPPRAAATARPTPKGGMPAVPTPVLAYHTPVGAAAPVATMWREKNLAVSYRDMPFPMRCVKCGAPLEPGGEKRTTMYWQHPLYYLTLFLGVLIGAIILVIVRQKTEVTFGLCKVHRTKRRNRILVGWLIALVGIGLEPLSVFFMSPGPWKNYGLTPLCATVGLICIVGSLVWAVVAVPAISVRKIKDRLVWFGGCGPEFLASLDVQGMR